MHNIQINDGVAAKLKNNFNKKMTVTIANIFIIKDDVNGNVENKTVNTKEYI